MRARADAAPETYLHRAVRPPLDFVAGVDEGLDAGRVDVGAGGNAEHERGQSPHAQRSSAYTAEKSSTTARSSGLASFSVVDTLLPGSFHGRSLARTSPMSLPRRVCVLM